MIVDFKELPKEVRKAYDIDQAKKLECEAAPDKSLYILRIEATEEDEGLRDGQRTINAASTG